MLWVLERSTCSGVYRGTYALGSREEHMLSGSREEHMLWGLLRNI